MKIAILDKAEMCKLAGEHYNPPSPSNQMGENRFQAEVRSVYKKLLTSLELFGKEGDHYGSSDFAIRPDLRQRPRVSPPPAYPVREFTITILSKAFYRSPFWTELHRLLSSQPESYRIVVDQDSDPEWQLTVFLTPGLACLYCTAPEELRRLSRLLSSLESGGRL